MVVFPPVRLKWHPQPTTRDRDLEGTTGTPFRQRRRGTRHPKEATRRANNRATRRPSNRATLLMSTRTRHRPMHPGVAGTRRKMDTPGSSSLRLLWVRPVTMRRDTTPHPKALRPAGTTPRPRQPRLPSTLPARTTSTRNDPSPPPTPLSISRPHALRFPHDLHPPDFPYILLSVPLLLLVLFLVVTLVVVSPPTRPLSPHTRSRRRIYWRSCSCTV
ncbi:hypothetical protein DFH06DRAFT_315504, partial [Mycena polygramma]